MSRAHTRIYSYPGIPKDTRRAVGKFVRWIRPLVRHRLTITVAPSEVLDVPGRGRAFGAFFWPASRRANALSVWLAGRFPEYLKRSGVDKRGERLRALLEILAHEFAHYEQWAAGKRADERGAENRARVLVNRFFNPAALPRQEPRA